MRSIRTLRSETVDRRVETHLTQPPVELIATALQVIDNVLEPNSELLQFWSEGDDGPA